MCFSVVLKWLGRKCQHYRGYMIESFANDHITCSVLYNKWPVALYGLPDGLIISNYGILHSNGNKYMFKNNI